MTRIALLSGALCSLAPLPLLAQDVSPALHVVSNAVQYNHVIWNGIPISFTVPVGQERILKFPSAVDFHNSNPKLTRHEISIQNNHGFLYITAKRAFSPIRIAVTLNATGQVILLDLSAKPNVSDLPVSVVMAASPATPANGKAVKPQLVNYVTLMRYALQHLYAPRRLIQANPAIPRTPMYTHKSVNLFRNSEVIAMPLMSWHGGNFYVTAVLLKNPWHDRRRLDPRNIYGQWLAASFYPTNDVMPSGSVHDRTMMLLISDRPFHSALTALRGYRG
tara:strand:- start:726 stop:1556 length:831 start_codon:yes stop_codon:yes gene_type:complete